MARFLWEVFWLLAGLAAFGVGIYQLVTGDIPDAFVGLILGPLWIGWRFWTFWVGYLRSRQ